MATAPKTWREAARREPAQNTLAKGPYDRLALASLSQKRGSAPSVGATPHAGDKRASQRIKQSMPVAIRHSTASCKNSWERFASIGSWMSITLKFD